MIAPCLAPCKWHVTHPHCTVDIFFGAQTMAFTHVTVLPLNASHLPVSTGSTVEMLAEANQGTPTPLVRDVANGTVWHDTALFIDHAEGSTLSKASTEGLLGL